MPPRPAAILGAIAGALVGFGLLSSSATPATPAAPRKRDRLAAEIVDRRGTLSAGASGQNVLGLQSLLARAGYPVGQDGTYGNATAEAVGRFQAAMGHTPTRVLDGPTLADLAAVVAGTDLVPTTAPTGELLSVWQVYGAAVMVSTARKRIERWGVPADGVILALAANAWAESQFQSDAGNTRGEDSQGLFQTNRNGGLGAGYATAELRNPETNTTIVLNEAERLGWPSIVGDQTIDEATRWFTTRIERPADMTTKAAIRGAYAREYARRFGIPEDTRIADLREGDS